MATPRMLERTNRRGHREAFFEGYHMKPEVLKDTAQGRMNKYLTKTSIPDYPRPKFHVSRLTHDTDLEGLKGIREKNGFRNRFYDGSDDHSLLWFSLVVGPEEIKAAEKRYLETTYSDLTEEQVQTQRGFMKTFATSEAFTKGSRFGSYRFTFSVDEVLEAYRRQFCFGAQPVMRVRETILYKSEVVYVVLVHSPDNQEQFLKYPVLADNPDSICTFRDNCFIWKSEAMCGTHKYRLAKDDAEKKMEAVCESPFEFYVWDNVAIALHVHNQVLEFDVDDLRKKLMYCQGQGIRLATFEGFQKAEHEVKNLWPNYPLPLMADEETTEEVSQEDKHAPEETFDFF